MSTLKKITVLFFCCCVFFMPVISQAAPKYLNGDKNLVLVYEHPGHSEYLDLNSVTSYYYEPPYYRLGGTILLYDPNQSKTVDTLTVYFDYYTNTHQVYRINIYTGAKSSPLNKQESRSDRHYFGIAKAVWKQAYNMDWK